MSPIDPKFSDDYHKFILQDQNYIPVINPNSKPVKPFNLNPPSKTKKDVKKNDKERDGEKGKADSEI